MHLLLVMLLLGAETGSLRCGNHLVTPGADKLEVLSRCGEPAWRERVSGDNEASREVWIYASPAAGAQKLLHFDGVSLVSIQDGDIGASRPLGGDSHRCGNSLVRAGETKLDVKNRCGEPALVEAVSGAEGTRREVWLYKDGEGSVALYFSGVRLDRVERRVR